MSLPLAVEPLPLLMDVDGAVRVGGTRVTLDTIVEAFQEGLAAEEIVQQYSSVALADVYAVIGYYLRRRSEVEDYLGERRRRAQAVREQNQARTDSLPKAAAKGSGKDRSSTFLSKSAPASRTSPACGNRRDR